MKKKSPKLSIKKITSYSTLAGAFLFVNNSTTAQTIFTDVDPDETFSTNGDEYLLDLNNDGTVDFKFKLDDEIRPEYFVNVSNSAYYSGLIRGVRAYDYNNAIGGDTGGSGTILPYAFENGVAISAGIQFLSSDSSGNQLLGLYLGVVDYPEVGSIYNFLSVGNWIGKTEKFIPLKLIDGGLTYYGWARLSVNATTNQFTIHDYAVEATPNTTIITGEGVTCATTPDIVGAMSAGTTSEKLKWTVETGIDYYQIYYRQLGMPTWSKKKSATNQKTITGLTCATNYEWKVRTNCGGLFSAFSATSTFTTAACRMDDMEDVATEITLYPNPAADFMYIDITTEITDGTEVFVTDMSGRTISGLNFTNDEDMLVLDVASLPAGLYMFSVRQGDVTTSANFVKQ